MALCIAAGNAPKKRVAARKYREIETVYTDNLNPGKNYRRKEVIDNQGNIIESWEWDSKGSVNQHIRYVISRKYKSKTIYDGLDSMVFTEFTRYNSEGRKIEHFQNNKRKHKTESTVFIYNKWGEKSEEQITKNGRLSTIHRYSYDNQGLLINQMALDSVGVIKSMKKINYSR